MFRVNVGCGMSPTEGWINFDNSFSIKLATFPVLASCLYRAGLIGQAQMAYIRFCQEHTIRWADATRHLPLADASAEVLYSSHMLEHLDRREAAGFLSEARRVLAPGGIIRVAVPDIEKFVDMYLRSKDADAFVESTHLSTHRPRRLAEKLRVLFVGLRHHQWMYDGASLCKLLSGSGFQRAQVCEVGSSHIPNPSPLNLREREEESVYVEAVRV